MPTPREEQTVRDQGDPWCRGFSFGVSLLLMTTASPINSPFPEAIIRITNFPTAKTSTAIISTAAAESHQILPPIFQAAGIPRHLERNYVYGNSEPIT